MKNRISETVRQKAYWSCLKKKNWSKKAADKFIEGKAKEGQLLYYYKCDLCGSFHLTKKQPKPKKYFEVL